MTKEKLIELLNKIAVANDPMHVRDVLMQVLTPLVKAGGENNSSCPITFERTSAETITLDFVVYDKSLVWMAWRKANDCELQLEPVRRASLDRALADGVPADGELPEGALADGIMADGVVALFRERPVLMIVAVGDDRLEVQVGGFPKSVVAHPGNLMGLQRQVIEQLRNPALDRGRQNGGGRSNDNG